MKPVKCQSEMLPQSIINDKKQFASSMLLSASNKNAHDIALQETSICEPHLNPIDQATCKKDEENVIDISQPQGLELIFDEYENSKQTTGYNWISPTLNSTTASAPLYLHTADSDTTTNGKDIHTVTSLMSIDHLKNSSHDAQDNCKTWSKLLFINKQGELVESPSSTTIKSLPQNETASSEALKTLSSSTQSMLERKVHFSPETKFVERNLNSPFWQDIQERRRHRILSKDSVGARVNLNNRFMLAEQREIKKKKRIKNDDHPLLPFLKLGWEIQEDDFFHPSYAQQIRLKNLGVARQSTWRRAKSTWKNFTQFCLCLDKKQNDDVDLNELYFGDSKQYKRKSV